MRSYHVATYIQRSAANITGAVGNNGAASSSDVIMSVPVGSTNFTSETNFMRHQICNIGFRKFKCIL